MQPECNTGITANSFQLCIIPHTNGERMWRIMRQIERKITKHTQRERGGDGRGSQSWKINDHKFNFNLEALSLFPLFPLFLTHTSFDGLVKTTICITIKINNVTDFVVCCVVDYGTDAFVWCLFAHAADIFNKWRFHTIALLYCYTDYLACNLDFGVAVMCLCGT